MRPSSVARRYAEAAFDVAQKGGNADTWLAELRIANSALRDQGLALFFKNPEVTEAEKLSALFDLFPRMQPQVLNVLRLLVVRHRLHLLPSVVAYFEGLDREAKGIVEAYVTVARPVDDTEVGAIKNRLTAVTGKSVQVHTRVDPAILGGIVVRIGDRLIDASVVGRLERLRQDMAV